MFTLNSTEIHCVCYNISPFHSNAMLSANPRSGIHQTGIAGTLDSNYYKGCGERQGIEREYIVEGVGDDSRPSDSENP